MSEPSLPLVGGCLCGAVRFEVPAPPVDAGYCHCTYCQRRTGTAASSVAILQRGTFRLVSGADHLGQWRPPGGDLARVFCADCGAHLYSQSAEDPEFVAVRMGAFDGDPGIRPRFRQFVLSAAPWEPIPDDGLPRYEERRPRP